MKTIGEKFYFNNKEYIISKFLGEGKSGYSYLIENLNQKLVLKMIHDRKDPYYNFGDKLEAELYAYNTLSALNINLPKLLYHNREEKYLVKEYIDGLTIAELTANQEIIEDDFAQTFEMSEHLKEHNINLDYFPFNFVKSNNKIFYIDYECNEYIDEWNFENWGIYYWLNSQGIKNFIENNRDHSYINKPNSAKPFTDGYDEQVKILKNKYIK